MVAILKSPWHGLGRQLAAGGARQHRAAASTTTQPALEARSHTRPVLPAFLESVPVSALRELPSLHAVQSISTVSGTISAVPRNALRSCNPIARSLVFHASTARQYSTLSRDGPLSYLRSLSRPSGLGLGLGQRRSLFGGPSVETLARLEQAACNNPNSALAQAAFYSALLRADMPNIVAERHRSGRWASDANVLRYYRKALQKLGQTDDSATNISSQQQQAVVQAAAAHVGGGQIAKTTSGAGLKSDPLYVVVEESTKTIVFRWVRWAFAFALASYVALVLITLFVETSGVLKKVGGGNSSEVRPESQSTRFDDVQGCDEAKEELADVVDFLKNPERYNKLGGRLPKGVLLVGPPGTGKTLLARAVAGEAGVPFFYMSGSEFDEMYVGVGAKRVRELFAVARSKSPAIVFIDELDAIGGKRKSRDAAYHRQTLNQLLNDLDGFDQSTGVIFIAATNHPELLDSALLRPGRFDRHVQVELPDVKGRLAILMHHTKKIRLSPEADLQKIARGTPGFSGAELENLANSAAIQASKHDAKFVSNLDLEWAKDKIMIGAERKSRIVPLQDKLQTAYHEGGHVLVGLHTKGSKEVHKATILARGPAAGITFFLPNEKNHRSRSQYIVELEISMGGKMAEEIVYGAENVSSGPSGDIQNATQMAHGMVTQYGFSDLLGNVDLQSNYEHLSPDTKRLIDSEVRRFIDEAKEKAKSILLEHRKELDLLAHALVQYETLDKEEILKVIKGEKLKDRLMAMPDTLIKIPEIPMPASITPGKNNDPPAGTGVPA
ncbi:cell division protease ftsH [Massariosphaeria phaeospora]|uniref:Cell division protease ftsH n=1 Tax=Massariosphaeria phaeospora TaxID=100035 RepID=A0A7C8MBR8_9PLEO|nr:cell division protease ftsH [Massariosphaeria phaeospora]